MSETLLLRDDQPAGRHPHRDVRAAVPGLELQIADDGELLVRGDLVMRGYRGDPEKTA